MKRFIVLVGLLGFLIVAYFVHDYLKESVEDQETIEWANSLVWAAIGSQSSVRFVEPVVAAGAEPGQWVVTGEIVLRQGASETATHPYSARVARLCDATDRRECWSLRQLTIGGSEIDLTGLEPDRPSVAGPAAAESAPAASPAPADGSSAGIATDDGGPGAGSAGEDAVQANGQAEIDGATPPPVKAAGEVASAAAETPPEAAPETTVAAPAEAPAIDTSAAAGATSQYVSERRQMIAEIQARLLDLGYDPGPVDGLMGPQTKTAIEDYQRKNDFTVNGEPSAQLLQLLERQQ